MLNKMIFECVIDISNQLRKQSPAVETAVDAALDTKISPSQRQMSLKSIYTLTLCFFSFLIITDFSLK